MIYVWGLPVVASVEDIVGALRTEIRASGVDLLRDMKPTAGNIMLTCPNHNGGTEKKPSLGILTEDIIRKGEKKPAGTCNCFVCGFTADLPEFISFCYGKKDAGQFGYKWITERFVNLVVEKRQPLALNMDRGRAADSAPAFITEEALLAFRFTHPYMYERKLDDKVIDYFDIGYDAQNHALTFPVHDLKGNVVLIQRRAIGRKQFLNDQGANKGDFIYGLYQVYKNLSWVKEVYVCESPLDALTCWTHRVAAVALMGAKATATQIKLLRALPVRKLVISLDNPKIDKAGQEGTDKLVSNLSDVKVLYRLEYPDGVKDCNEMTDEQFRKRQIMLA